MKVHILPIEPFPERYTQDWFDQWKQTRNELGIQGISFNGDMTQNYGITGPNFLNPSSTWIWKGSQVTEVAKNWIRITEGDWFLHLDGWGPAPMAIAYMSKMTGKPVHQCLFLHAGSYDPWDRLALNGLKKEALPFEQSLLNCASLVLVGSQWHENLLRQTFNFTGKIEVTGYPINQKRLYEKIHPGCETRIKPWNERAPIVVFPHRKCVEKDPEFFEAVKFAFRNQYPDLTDVVFAYSQDICKDKREYYELLENSKVVFSSARQETFGIAQQEGIALGCWSVHPYRLAYDDSRVMREGTFIGYTPNDVTTAVNAIYLALTRDQSPHWDGYHEDAIKRGFMAIQKMDTYLDEK